VESFRRLVRGGGLPAAPIEIFLEVSNVCDLKCVMCPPFSALNPSRKLDQAAVGPGFLAVDAVTDAMDGLLRRALVVHAFGYGEPTIHPGFTDTLERLAAYEVLLDFFTNGMHLSPDLVESLIRLSIHRVTVSFSGATREHYESVYQGGRFERVCDGLARLRDARLAARSAYPQVHINSLAFDHHMRSLDRFVALMADLGVDRIEVTRLVEHASVLPQLAGHAADMRSPDVRRALRRARILARWRRVELALHPDLVAEEAGTCPGPREGGPRVAVEDFPDIARRLPVRPPPAGSPPPIPVLDIEADSDAEIRARLGIAPARPRGGESRPFACLEPFKTMYVRRRGHAKACCYMDNAAPALGDVARSGGEAVWNGRGFAAMRAAFGNGEQPEKACGHCLAHKQAPPGHGVDRMLDEYASWHREVFGIEFPRDAFADLTAAPDGESVIDRLAAVSPGLLEAPGARERERRLHAHVADVTRLEGVPNVLFEGWVDRVAGRGVSGWLWSPLYPDLRLTVSVEVDGQPVASAVARLFRPDLRAARKGDGCHAFALDLGREDAIRPGQRVAVRIGDTRCRLEGAASLAGPEKPPQV
jgi:MoaA/NifB/PqqE/SkfB family radical SAM enzyme